MPLAKYSFPLTLICSLGLLSLGGCGSDESEQSESFPAPTNPGPGARGPSTDAGAAPQPPPMSPQEPVDQPPPAETRAFNPWTAAGHDPFSTFAADVDSASYDIFVKSMSEAGLPPDPASVRSEEFINFFSYEYPAPAAEGHPFAIDLDVGPAPVGDSLILRVGIQGRDILAERAAANLVFLIDVSGSMSSEDKLPLAKRLLVAALDVLQPDDTVSIVTYAGEVRLALAPTPVADRAAIEQAIVPLRAAGSTAGGDGLRLAYDQAEAAFVAGGINHIILCTDGDFNVGPYTTQEIVSLVEQRRPSGVTFTALGFGLGNLNDDMMEAVSNAGNGIYRVVTGDKTARRYVQRRLLADVAHIAKDVKLQVEFNPDYVYAYRQIGYENRQLADDDFRDDTVDAGEIGSGHQVTALYEVVLVNEAVPADWTVVDGDPVEGPREVGPNELVMVKLRYKAPGATETDAATEMRVGFLEGTDVATLTADAQFAWAAATLAGQLANNPFVSSEAAAAMVSVADPLQSGDQDRTELVNLMRAVAAGR